MIRVHLKPLEIAKLKKCAPSYISNIRKSLLLKIFGIEGSSELFDDEIGKIGRKDTGWNRFTAFCEIILVTIFLIIHHNNLILHKRLI